MMNLAFANRNRKELMRDPLSLLFGVGLPVFLLLLISVINQSLPVDIFQIDSFTPGMTVFAMAFLTLFGALLISKDKTSAFLARLFASPMSATGFIAGYTLPMLPMGLIQATACFVMAMFFGLKLSVNMLVTLAVLIPCVILFTGFGLLLGSLFNDKQVGGFFTIFVQVVALSSGMWFDLSLISGAVNTISYLLPFAHAVDMTRAALAGQITTIWPHLAVVSAWAIAIFALAVLSFRKRMKA